MKRPQPLSKSDRDQLNNWPKWDLIQTVVIGVDQVAREMENTWGMGRLLTLVSDATRLRFKKGHSLWCAAIRDSDLEAVRELGPKLVAAWRFMAREADALGHSPLSAEVMEARLPDGRVLAICRTVAEAHEVVRRGRATLVFTVDEIARLAPRLDLVNEVKTAFPGATVERVTVRDETFAEQWATESPWLDLHEEHVG